MHQISIRGHTNAALCRDASGVRMMRTRFVNDSGQNAAVRIAGTPFVYGVPAGGTWDCVTDQDGRFILGLRGVHADRQTAIVWDGRCTHTYDLAGSSRSPYRCMRKNMLPRRSGGPENAEAVHQENGIGVSAAGELLHEEDPRGPLLRYHCIMAAGEEAALTMDRKIDFRGTLHSPARPKDDAPIVDLQSCPDGVLALSADGSVFFSPDCGHTWQTLVQTGATAIALSARDGSAAVAAADETVTLYRCDRGSSHALIADLTIPLAGEHVCQLALSAVYNGFVLVWLSAGCSHGVIRIAPDGKHRSIPFRLADDLYARCHRAPHPANEPLEIMIDQLLGDHSGRSAARMIHQGNRDYLLARQIPDRYLYRKDFMSVHVPLVRLMRFRRRLRHALTRVRVSFRRCHAGSRRRKALLNLCHILPSGHKARFHARLYLMGVGRLADEAARLLSARIKEDADQDMLLPPGCQPDPAAGCAGDPLLAQCCAAGDYLLRRTLIPYGGDCSSAAYHAGLIHAFRLEAALTCLCMEDGAARDAALEQCCRAFLLANLALIAPDQKASRHRRSVNESLSLCHAANDALHALRRPLPVSAFGPEGNHHSAQP